MVSGIGGPASPSTRMGAAQGFAHLMRGVRLWRTRTPLMLLGLVPALIVALLVLAGFVALFLYADDLIETITPFADDWASAARGVFRFLLLVVVVVGAGFLAMVTFTGLTLAVGDPFYEKIWKEIEIELGGPAPDEGVGWIRGIVDGLVLVAAGLLTAVLVFAVGLLPVVGTVAGLVIGFLVSGRLLAVELISRPLEARGLDRAARKALLRPHRRAVLGFGAGVQASFLVPFGAVLMMPAAVAGATYLAREALDADPGVKV